MRNVNTTGVSGYVFDLAVMYYTTLVAVRSFMMPLKGYSTFSSGVVLFIASLCFVTAFFIATVKTRRNALSAFTCCVFPFEVYAVINGYFKTLTVILLVLFAICAGTYLYALLSARCRNIKRRVYAAVKGTLTIASLCLFPTLVAPVVKAYFPQKAAYVYCGDVEPDGADQLYSAAAAIKKWSETGEIEPEEKLALARDIVTYECIREKTGVMPQVSIGPIFDRYSLAFYDTGSNSIVISENSELSSVPIEFCTAVLHEFRHFWQKEYVDAYRSIKDPILKNMAAFDEAKKWEKNYMHYEKHGDGYYDQSIELDAREWSEEAVFLFMRLSYDIGE